MPHHRPTVAPVLLLALLTLGRFAPTLDNGFSLDDFNWLERARFSSTVVEFVLQPEPGQLLNPVPRGLFWLLHLAAGLDPLPYRLAILMLHLVAALLLLALVSQLARDWRVGLLAAVLFSLHTAYDEALLWVAALFHPLVAVLGLGALVAFVRHLDRPRIGTAAASSLLFAAACLTKASAFAVLAPAAMCLALPGLDRGRRRSGARLLIGLGAVAGAVLLVNLVVGTGDSYLVERGYYRSGPHLVSNLGHYAAWLVLPHDQAFRWLGLAGAYTALFGLLRWIAPVALASLVVAGSPATRVLATLALAGLVPFLPFVFEPVSRYTYLGCAGISGTAALLVHDVVRRWPAAGAAATRRRLAGAAAAALGGLLLFSAADTRLRDNHYEHRERLMAGWVEDVARAVGAPPGGAVLWIVGLPTLAIDPGIHLEAALRLKFGDPDLRLRVLDLAPDDPLAGIVLEYHEGRIRPLVSTPGPPLASVGPEVPRDDAAYGVQMDRQQGQRDAEDGP